MKEALELLKPTKEDYLKKQHIDFDSEEDLVFVNRFNWSPEVYEVNGKKGLKNCIGEVLTDAVYDDFYNLPNFDISLHDKVVAVVNNKCGVVLLDGKGTWLVQPEYDYIGYPNQITYMKKEGKWGVYNLYENKFILPLVCDWLSHENGFLFCNEVAFYGIGDKTGVILGNGEFTRAMFDDVEMEDNGTVKVFYQKEWGYVNEEGQFTKDEDEAYFIGLEM